MRLRNITGSREVIGKSRYVIQEPEQYPGKWGKEFGNDHPVYAEIGMGKGRFLMEMAKGHPDVNFVGIEKYSSVLLRAVQKMEMLEASGEILPNVRFVRMEAEDITKVFREGELNRIYLNFSDPWPKERHAKRRLPSRQFLERYDRVLQRDGVIEFKTDNRPLFDFAVEEFGAAGWKALELTYDLHADEGLCRENVMTEYEARFVEQGNPICKYKICR